MHAGLKILLDTYWNSKGWKNGAITVDDFQSAKSDGYMFDYPIQLNHNKTLKYTKELVNKIEPQDIANAFLFSLSTRKLEYRSALGSYYYAKSIPIHNELSSYGICYICGFREYEKKPNEYEQRHGYNIFNFERYKWGGVRHDLLNYAAFDLEQFLLLPKVVPKADDINILKLILLTASELEPNQKVGAYVKLLINKKIFNTNKNEIDTLIGILGICDVLNSKDYKGYLNSFTNNDSSRDPVEHKNDYKYPANRWHVEDGINYDAVNKVFNNLFF